MRASGLRERDPKLLSVGLWALRGNPLPIQIQLGGKSLCGERKREPDHQGRAGNLGRSQWGALSEKRRRPQAHPGGQGLAGRFVLKG